MDTELLFSRKGAHRILKSVFGYDDFRPGQLDAMKPLARGRDVLVVMPTGSGKSVCYQVPALCSKGTALVVSPLIALMKDQVDALRKKGAPVAYVNSSLTTRESDKVLRKLEKGRYKILYVAPERFNNTDFCQALSFCDISFLAIDEAHAHQRGSLIHLERGLVSVEDVRIGDAVIGWCEQTGVVINEVQSIVTRKESVLSCVEIYHDYGILRVTVDHPVWLDNVGYIPAGSVVNDDQILSTMCEGFSSRRCINTQNAADLRDNSLLFVAMSQKLPQKRDAVLELWQKATEGFSQNDLLKTVFTCKDRRWFVASHERGQSHAIASLAAQNVRYSQTYRTQAEETRRQRSTFTESTSGCIKVVSELGSGILRVNWHEEEQSAVVHKSGLCRSGAQKDCRGRWQYTLRRTQEKRSKKRSYVRASRVVRVESSQQRSFRGFREYQEEDCEVFTLTVNGNATYFADGALNHNCISHWGHDFRPAYRNLGSIRESLSVPTIALTATATVKVQDDIVAQLNMPSNYYRLVTGFDRPNLNYVIRAYDSAPSKEAAFMRLVGDAYRAYSCAGIVYCGTRKQAEHVFRLLNQRVQQGMCGLYHAGMSDDRRQESQDAFMDGDVPWIAATNAFGMGVDKSDIRYVVHYNLPGSVEAWYQEVGRAGRDNQPSKCVTMYSRADVGLQWYFFQMQNPDQEIFKKLWDLLWSYRKPVLTMSYAEVYKAYAGWYGKSDPEGAITTAMTIMKRFRAIEPTSRKKLIQFVDQEKKAIGDYVDFEQLKVKRDRDRQRLECMLRFAQSTAPVRERVLEYFGEVSKKS